MQDTHKATIQRTYRITPATVEAIDALAARLELHQSAIVDALLTRAVAEVSAGKWTIRRRAAVWELAAIEET